MKLYFGLILLVIVSGGQAHPKSHLKPGILKFLVALISRAREIIDPHEVSTTTNTTSHNDFAKDETTNSNSEDEVNMDNSTITNANKTSHSDNNRNINQNHSPPENDTLINQTSGPATDVNTNDTAKHQNIDLTSKQTNVSLNLDTDKAAIANKTANFSSVLGSSVLNQPNNPETDVNTNDTAHQTIDSLTSKQTNVSLNLDADKAAIANKTANFSSVLGSSVLNQPNNPETDVNTNDTAHQTIDSLTSKQTNVSLNLDADKAASTNETANFSSISVSTFSNGSSVLNSGDAKENTKFAASEIASQSVSSEAAVPSSDGVKVIGSSDGPIDAGEQGATDKSSKVQADHNVITGSISTTAKDATVVTSYQNSTTEEISGKHERNASNVTKTIETSTEPDIEHNTESIRTIAKERATNLGSNSSTVKPPSSRSSNADDLAAKNERSHVKSSASKSSSSSRKRSDRADAGGNKSVKQAPVGNSQAKQAPVGNSPAENSARAAEFSGNMSEHRK
ncbi:hypothetical protein JYU34_008171 [Plutella xylostella]|uniref:Uncharacterized protein n=1 Tax=Plutella xylostella TaxID=51655 RepID=A0ABQ7QNZ1_PLUXY|nr:hypothetical protein JYU34_008171 [Plutella xylostella]